MEATKVTGKDRTIQLLDCCDDQLRKDVTRSIGMGRTLTDRPEEEILTLVRRLAVREENTMVARVALHNMRQDRDETVRSFSSRIRGQAGVCKFFLPCPGCSQTVHYTEEVLRDVVIRGLEDPEIQLDLLGEKNQDMTFEEVLRFIEANEAGKRSASRLIDTHGQRQLRARTLPTKEWSAFSTNPKPDRAPVRSAAKRVTDGWPHRTFIVLSDPHTILLALPAIRNTTLQQFAGVKIITNKGTPGLRYRKVQYSIHSVSLTTSIDAEITGSSHSITTCTINCLTRG